MLRGTYGVVPNFDSGKVSAKREFQSKKKPHQKQVEADDQLFYCTECKRVYEYIRNNKTKRTVVQHYEDFPTFGKLKIVCPECKVNKGLENV